jgi:hypothetical protein
MFPLNLARLASRCILSVLCFVTRALHFRIANGLGGITTRAGAVAVLVDLRLRLSLAPRALARVGCSCNLLAYLFGLTIAASAGSSTPSEAAGVFSASRSSQQPPTGPLLGLLAVEHGSVCHGHCPSLS